MPHVCTGSGASRLRLRLSSGVSPSPWMEDGANVGILEIDRDTNDQGGDATADCAVACLHVPRPLASPESRACFIVPRAQRGADRRR
mmetsp:Transcript_2592/g.9979  ORF Transcript_2592/g.9979 Transcript_2592/m.9979 type:complete len:87 (+) Transcript_2592:326-586(+)